MLLLALLTTLAPPRSHTPDLLLADEGLYEATYRDGGLSFEPAGASEAASLRVRLTGVSRGDTELLVPNATPAPRQEWDRLRIDWPGFEERYERTSIGVEQSFVFPAPLPGSGDLVVELAVETQLELSHASPRRATYGRDGRGIVAVQKVIGIDADGRRCPGSLRARRGRLDLVLPAAFVDRAAYPLVLDPILVPLEVVYPDDGASLTDVAWEPGSGQCCLVWNEIIEGDRIRTRLLTLDPDGQPSGLFTLFETSDSSVLDRPVICNVNRLGRIVVATREGVAHDARIHVISARPDGASAPVVVDFEAPWLEELDIGGDPTPGWPEVCVLWANHAAAGGELRARIFRLDEAGVPEERHDLLVDDGSEGPGFHPRISQGCGRVGRTWLTAWDRRMPDGSFWPHLRTIGSDGRIGPVTPTCLAGDTPSVDGDGEEFLVSYRRKNESGGFEIIGESVQANAFSIGVGFPHVLFEAQEELVAPQVAVVPDRLESGNVLSDIAFSVAWTTKHSPTSSDSSYRVVTISGPPVYGEVHPVTSEIYVDQRAASRLASSFDPDEDDLFALSMKVPAGVARAYGTH